MTDMPTPQPDIEADAPPSPDSPPLEAELSAAAPAVPSSTIAELTLAEALDRLVRSPRRTGAELLALMSERVARPELPPRKPRVERVPAAPLTAPVLLDPEPAPEAVETPEAEMPPAPLHTAVIPADEAPPREGLALGMRVFGLIIGYAGTALMAYAPARTEANALLPALPLLLIAAALWFAAARVSAPRRATPRVDTLSEASDADAPLYDEPTGPLATVTDNLVVRVTLGLMAAACGFGAFAQSGGNLFRLPGVLLWAASILLTLWALAPAGWTPFYPLRRWAARLRTSGDQPAARITWVTLALLAIIAFGAYFRLSDIDGTPPEMTSDHVEKLLDSQRVLDGGYNIYFQNNGGREPLQMYVMAAFVGLTGLPMEYDTLKLVTALEGILSLPVFFWLGRELVGRHNPRLGLLVGLALAALIAVSYWHVSLSRLALRIVYTPMITALLFIYLSRALRDNRRIDYLNAGLALGLALYMYQVARILPVVVVIGVGMAVLFFARGWVARRRYVLNLLALVAVSFAVFIPLFRFSFDYPEDFWRRSSGRLFGDELTQVTNPDGTITERVPTFNERIEAFQENIPTLVSNVRNALLMYNWKGDVAWINGAPNQPAMDPLAGALLIVGLGGWAGWTVRRRDPALWLAIPAALVLIFPSALAIAYPIENPSATRMSGTLPFVYLLAAFALGTLAAGLWSRGGRQAGAVLAALVITGASVASFLPNQQTYFGDFRAAYLISSKPYSDAGGVIRMFANSEGGYGNAFMIAYPYWWDHRAIGIDAGRINWPNGIISRDEVPRFLRDAERRSDSYRLEVDRPLMFLYSPDDVDTELRLQLWFPQGSALPMQSYQPEDTYRIYRVPALGAAAFAEFVNTYAPQ